MRCAEVGRGRRIVVVLENGDDVLASIARACAAHGIRAAIIPVFLGAFSTVSLIGTRDPIADHDVPLPAVTDVHWVEGVGGGSVAPAEDGSLAVHLHAAVGVKADAALGYAGHVTAAITHYTAELVLDEVTDAELVRRPDAAAHGIPTLCFA
jgi:predicted DNA-binding protein with PD1-like motif